MELLHPVERKWALENCLPYIYHTANKYLSATGGIREYQLLADAIALDTSRAIKHNRYPHMLQMSKYNSVGRAIIPSARCLSLDLELLKEEMCLG